MTRALNRLTVRKVSSISASGRHADGGGLYLRITPGGARSWVFMAVVAGKRTEVGLGAESAVSLMTARKIAGDMREAVATRRDPRSIIAKLPSPEPFKVLTFEAFADDYITSVEGGWKNAVHRQQWRNSLRDHAKLVMTLPVSEVGTDEVSNGVQKGPPIGVQKGPP